MSEALTAAFISRDLIARSAAGDPERMVGRVIGKKGATLAKIREACPQVSSRSPRAARFEGYAWSRVAQASADIARCLTRSRRRCLTCNP